MVNKDAIPEGYIKYCLRKQYRQDKRQLQSDLSIAEVKEIGDSENKLKAYKVKYRYKVIRLIIYAALTVLGMFFAPDVVPKLIENLINL